MYIHILIIFNTKFQRGYLNLIWFSRLRKMALITFFMHSSNSSTLWNYSIVLFVHQQSHFQTREIENFWIFLVLKGDPIRGTFFNRDSRAYHACQFSCPYDICVQYLLTFHHEWTYAWTPFTNCENYFFKNAEGVRVTVSGARYIVMINGFLLPKIFMNKSSQEMDPWVGLQDLVIWHRWITFCGGMWNYLLMLIKHNRLMHFFFFFFFLVRRKNGKIFYRRCTGLS